MKSIRYLSINILILLSFSFISKAQTNYNSIIVTDTIKINFENQYSISSVNIIPFSETIYLRGKILSRSDYNFIYSKGYFTLSDSLPYSIFDSLIVSYSSLRLSLKKEYKRRSLIVKVDENLGDTIRVAQTEAGGFTPESIFGPGIQKSGTLIRGFTVGTTRDFSISGGLRLQLSGKLSDEIEIVAALSDENSPIQPEGNTQSLEEIDKVFIQVKHPNAIGTFGDYQMKWRYGEFGVIDRKLQGLMGEFNVTDVNGYAAIASSKGKFNSNNFNGLDGVQGPYRLSGINNEKDIIILAGTEKVFLDGVQMVRGENNDYTIEYSNSTITFTPKRLITSASRINVDFEYSDRQFSRNFFGAGTQASLLNNFMNLKFQYIREGDDQDAPIDITLSESDKQIIADAGDDKSKAVKSGVRLAQPDSLGKISGIYTQIDTTINNSPFQYYVYNPGDSLSLYDVTFSFVGSGKGDYLRESIGVFKFVGIGQGEYLPVILLPVPELKQIGNFVMEINPLEKVSLNLEYAGSLYDKNRLSTKDKGDDYGYATNINLSVAPSQIKIGSLDFGKVSFSYKDRFIQKRFTSLDRFNEVEFDRNYNVTTTDKSEDESLREASLNYEPIEKMRLFSSAGFLRKGDSFSSDRFNNIIRYFDKDNFNVEYNLDYVKSSNLNVKSNWIRQKGNSFYTFWKLKPGFDFLSEDKEDKQSSSDSLLNGSLKYYEIAPFLELMDLEGFSFLTRASFRDDYLPLNGDLLKESKSRAQSFELNYRGIREVSGGISLTIRNKNYEQAFKERGFLDNQTILVRSQTKYLFWQNLLNGDLFYEVSTQRTAKLQKVFVRVETGAGNYIYLGDLNNNGIADENEFQLTIYDGDYVVVVVPTDELFPVIDLKFSTRWKLNFKELIDNSSLAGKIISPLSSETLWRVEETSRETDYSKIYLMNFSSFLNDSTTIRGSNFIQQDLFIFENSSEISFRFRFAERASLNEFNDGKERGYFRERSVRIKFRLIQEVTNQTDIINQSDNLSAPATSTRNREISSNNISTEFSYRPARDIELGFKIKVGRSEDAYPEKPTIIDNNSQLVRLNLSFLSTGRLRMEIERNELSANTDQNFIPFEITGGSQIGKNYFWRLNFDYRLASFLQTSLSYDGRFQAAGKVIHTAKAEARAYF